MTETTKVFHKKEFRELMKDDYDTVGHVAMLDAQKNATWPKDYIQVATVDTADKERAFELTNHIDHPWHDNKGVTCHGGPHRSTSVGDVVVLPDGTALLCARIGWEELAPANSE